MDKSIRQVFIEAQNRSTKHAKLLKILETIYKAHPMNEFLEVFLQCITATFFSEISLKSPFVDRGLQFATNFCAAKMTDSNDDPESQTSSISDQSDDATNPFVAHVIYSVLEYHNNEDINLRYHACKFITLLLKQFGDLPLDNDLCDRIQSAMLERIWDTTVIRLQAITALVRLQDISDTDCPVITSFLSCLTDNSPLVRRAIVERIAPTILTIPRLVDRIRDTEPTVRVAAYLKLIALGPRVLKIVSRQWLVVHGVLDEDERVRRACEMMVARWVAAFDGDVVGENGLLRALRLDACAEECRVTVRVYGVVLGVWFRNNSIRELLSALPLNKEKLIESKQLSLELVVYWKLLRRFLAKSSDLESHLDDILPEMAPFCDYIDSYIQDELISSNVPDIETMESQHILQHLLEMIMECDFADEAGRQTLRKFVTETLLNVKLTMKNSEILLEIFAKLETNYDVLSQEVCQIVSDIREPLILEEHRPSDMSMREREFLLANLRIKLNIATEEHETALARKNFIEAMAHQADMERIAAQIENLPVLRPIQDTQNELIRQTPSADPDTLVRCVNLIIAVLRVIETRAVQANSTNNNSVVSRHREVRKLPVCLQTAQREFLAPMLESARRADVYSRTLHAQALCCYKDKTLAVESVRDFFSPLIAYRLIPNYDKGTVLVCIKAFCDLMRIYGPGLVNLTEVETDSNHSQSEATHSEGVQKKTTRKLYRISRLENVESMDINNCRVEDILDIILDMIDDEDCDIREKAGICVIKLIARKVLVTSSLFTRILLKWFNPLTAQQDGKLLQVLGPGILKYARLVKNNQDIIENAVLPTLQGIVNAPKTSPLSDCDQEQVMKFLSVITSYEKDNQVSPSHRNLAGDILGKLTSPSQNKYSRIYSKMLLFLEPPEDRIALNELISQCELQALNETDKWVRKTIQKYQKKLKDTINNLTTISEVNETNLRESTVENSTITENNVEITTIVQIERNPEKDLVERLGQTENCSARKSPDNDSNTSSKKRQRTDRSLEENAISRDSSSDSVISDSQASNSPVQVAKKRVANNEPVVWLTRSDFSALNTEESVETRENGVKKSKKGVEQTRNRENSSSSKSSESSVNEDSTSSRKQLRSRNKSSQKSSKSQEKEASQKKLSTRETRSANQAQSPTTRSKSANIQQITTLVDVSPKILPRTRNGQVNSRNSNSQLSTKSSNLSSRSFNKSNSAISTSESSSTESLMGVARKRLRLQLNGENQSPNRAIDSRKAKVREINRPKTRNGKRLLEKETSNVAVGKKRK